jgi:LPS-assembly protein
VKRKSGFLAPSFGASDNLGFIYEQAYHWALSPSYDLTFRPSYMTEQGVLWQADWRQRIWNGQYSVKIAAIDQDADDLPGGSALNEDLDGWRGSVETKGLFSLSSWWKSVGMRLSKAMINSAASTISTVSSSQTV